MKKLIALTLCMLLLLSGCAGGAGAGLQLRDMLLSNGTEDVLDARGLSAALEFGRSGDVMGLRLTVARGDGEANEAVLALVDDTLQLTLDGGTGDPYIYAIEDPDIAAAVEEGLNGLVPQADAAGEKAPDFESMTDEELEAYMAQLEKELEDMGLTDDSLELTPEQERELEETTIKLQRFQELIESCITEGEPQQFDGESYSTTNIDIDSDTMRELLDLLQVSEMVSDSASLGQMLADAGITAEASAVIAVNEDGTKSAYGISPVFTSDDGDSVKINFTVQNTHGDGSADVYFDLARNGEPQAALSVTFAAYELEDTDWLPTEVSAGAAALDLEDEQSLDGFVDALADFLGQVNGTVMGVTMANRLLGMLN